MFDTKRLLCFSLLWTNVPNTFANSRCNTTRSPIKSYRQSEGNSPTEPYLLQKMCRLLTIGKLFSIKIIINNYHLLIFNEINKYQCSLMVIQLTTLQFLLTKFLNMIAELTRICMGASSLSIRCNSKME